MEATPLFELNALRRDWIEGTSGEIFFSKVEQRLAQIQAIGEDVQARGVMLVETDSLQFATAYFAATYLRVPVILANPKWRRLEWEAVAQLVNPALIFGSSPLTEESREGIQYPGTGTILIPTGGSSNGVKFAIHEWQTLAAACQGFTSLIGLDPVNTCCMLPLYHVSGLMQLMRCFHSRGQIIFSKLEDFEAGKISAFAPESICLSLVPTQLQRLILQRSILNWLRKLQAIFVGGAPMSESIANQARALKLPIVLSYGMTETAAMVTALPSDEFLAGNTSVGRSLSHASIEVVRDNGTACSIGEIGCIRIHASSMFKGYHGRSETIPGAAYLTDDEGYFDSSGCLQIVGRNDRLIISGGEKIDPHEVEQAIMHAGAVEEALAIGWPDPEWGQRLVAFFVPAHVAVNTQDLELKLRANLVNYKIPKQIIQVPRLPFDERGKIDRGLIEPLVADSLGKLEG